MAYSFKKPMEQAQIQECQGKILRYKFCPVDETILRRLWYGY